MTPRITPLVFFCLTGLLFPALGAGQSLVNAPLVEGTTTITGTVLWVSPSEFTVNADGNRFMRFQVDEASRGAARLDVGEPVRVTYHDRGTALHVARVTSLEPGDSARGLDEAPAPTRRGVPVQLAAARPRQAFRVETAGYTAPADVVTPPADETSGPQMAMAAPMDSTVSAPATPTESAAPAEQPVSMRLPATAGTDPLLELLGLGAILGGLGLGFVATRRG